MSSVSPLSSASNVSNGLESGPVCPDAPGFLRGGVDCGNWTEGQLAVVLAYYKAVESYNNAALGMVAVATTPQSSVLSSVSGLSKSARRRARRGRRGSSVESLRVDELVSSGGYLDCVIPDQRDRVYRMLGQDPSLIDLMKLPEADVLPAVLLSKLRCDVVDGVVLMNPDGLRSMLDVVASLAVVSRTGLGTLGGMCGFGSVDRELSANMKVPFVGALVQPERGFESGYCYLRLVRSGWHLSARTLLGAYPEVNALLMMPVEWCDVGALGRCRIGSSVAGLHIDAVSDHFALDVLAAYAADCRSDPHSLAAVLQLYRGRSLAEWVAPKLVRVGAADLSMLAQRVSRQSALPLSAELQSGLELVFTSNAFLGEEQKKIKRLWEAVGDSVLSTTIATAAVACNLTVADYQNARSALTSNDNLARFAEQLGLGDYMPVVAGVNFRGRVAANTFEAMLGLIYQRGGMVAVVRYCQAVGYYRSYSGFDKFTSMQAFASLGWLE